MHAFETQRRLSWSPNAIQDLLVTVSRSITFFDEQFRRQRDGTALELNPFEKLTLPYLRGSVLDVGCGLGNLAFAAAAHGCRVVALDASPIAIEHVRARAAAEGVDVTAVLADLRDYRLAGEFDCVVSIGLLMFFDCPTAHRVLAFLQSHVRPGGIAAINVLVEGTTFFDMFDPAGYCLFEASELENQSAGWEMLRLVNDEFAAPRNTIKRFCTAIARKP